MAKGLPFLWCFAVPFLVLAPFTAWKAVRPDDVYLREEEKFDAFTKRHPILASFLILGAIAGGLLSIGGVILRILAALTK
jgi:hypothetical protein